MTNVWPVVPMGQLCKITSGSSDTQDAVADGEFAFFDRSKTVKRSNRFLHDCEALIIPGEGTSFLPRYFKGKFDLHQRAYAICDLDSKLNIHFLLYCLYFQDDYFPRVAVGATVKSLRRRHFEEFPVSLPPLAEQQRIVRLLDEAFGGIAVAKANAEQNLRNTRALCESYLRAAFTQGVLERDGGEGGQGGAMSVSWPVRTLAEVCQLMPGKREARIKLDPADEVSFVPMEDLGVNSMRVKALKSRPLSDVAGSYTYFAEGDVLLAKITPCFENGKLGIATNLINGVGFGSSEYFVLRPDATVSAEWLYHYLNRESFRLEGAARMSGAVGHRRVTKEYIESYPIPVPLLSEQQRIISKLDELVGASDVLASAYVKKLAALDDLQKSLLNQAFRGELEVA